MGVRVEQRVGNSLSKEPLKDDVRRCHLAIYT